MSSGNKAQPGERKREESFKKVLKMIEKGEK